jgi:two-component system NarL family sensor kinase
MAAEQESERFARSIAQSILDALSARIAVLNQDGLILMINQSWREFALAHRAHVDLGVGANYLRIIDEGTATVGVLPLPPGFAP